MFKKIHAVWLGVCLSVIFFCHEVQAVGVVALDVSGVEAYSAVGNADVTDISGGSTYLYGSIYWGTTSGSHPNNCFAGAVGMGHFSCNLTNLSQDTTYYYVARIFDSYHGWVAISNEMTFHTSAITVTNEPASNITASTVTANGNVLNTGGSTYLTGSIYWGTTSGSHPNNCFAGSVGLGHFSCNLTGLSPNTTYYYVARIFDSYHGWVAISEERVIRTPLVVASIPLINDQFVDDIVARSAVGIADVTSTNNQDATKYIDWGLSSGDYTHTCNALDVNADGDSYCAMTGLKPDTTYYFRARAVNNIGTSYGSEVVFHTLYTSYENNFENLNLTISENLTLNCGSSVDLDNGTTLTAGTPQTNTTTCSVTTNDQSGYTLSLTNDRGTNNTLYNIIDNATQDGQIQDKTPWDNTSPNATNWTGTGLGFGILTSTATKNESWWGNANTCDDSSQYYAGIPQSDTTIMDHTSYSNTNTDTTICYKIDVPSTQRSGEYTGSVTYTATNRP